MSIVGSPTSVLRMPNSSSQVPGGVAIAGRPQKLLGVGEVAQWLGVSKGWVRDHAAGRRQPRLRAIKLGPLKSKGLWKFREEDVQAFIEGRVGDANLR
jgi:hypothetical protein